jgi:hypothetical protein
MGELGKFDVRKWYIGLIVVAVVIFLAALAAGAWNITILATGAGLVGFGEWINHPPVTHIHSRYKFTASERENTIFGWVVNIIGVAIIVVGLVRLLR